VSDHTAPRTDAPAPPPIAPRAPAKPVGKMERIWDHDSEDDSDDRRPVRRQPRPPAGGVGLWPWSDGVIPRGKVRMACFVVLALSMFAAGALCIMAVWNPDQTGVAWKSIASLGIVAALAAGFTLLNEVFGPKKGDTTA
jgi:hypothetical protein